jgi:futalosine hydrolase
VIALLCSVMNEANLLHDTMTVMRTSEVGSKRFIEGSLVGRDVVLAVGGMGKVNAAHATTVLIERYTPGAVVVFGMGGAYPSSGATVGDVAVARDETAGDEGVLTVEGFRDTRFIGIPLITTASSTIFNRFPAPDALFRSALRTLQSSPVPGGGRVHSGTFVTLSTCTGTDGRARELEQRYQGLCENMEGAAVAQVAMLHGLPWLEVRCISNIVEDRDLATWDIPRAARIAQQAVLSILDGWER